MTTQPWHVESRDLAAYRDGHVVGVGADSIEAHLLQCGECRSALAATATTLGRDERWARIADVIDRPSRASRLAPWLRIALGTPERLLSAALLLLVIVTVPVFAVLGDVRAGTTWFLALAPAFPAVGAVAAYRLASDPSGEISTATPMHSFRIVAVRALVALTLVLPIGVAFSVLLPERSILLLGWVLPGLAFCTLVLAAGTRFDPAWLGGALAAGWAVLVVGGMHRRRGLPVGAALEGLAINQPATQVAAAVVGLLATAVFLVRRDDVTYALVTMSAVIDASQLTKRYRSTVAVRDVDLRADGGVVGLLGPNGSGKTTLLRMLATVLAPSSGRLQLFGGDPGRGDDRVRIRRRLGYLPQHAGLYLGFTAYDLVDYVAVLKEMTNADKRRDEVRRVLELVGLSDAMHQKVRTMSGGTRRRVAIAAALIGAPDLLVVDEPGAGLDPDQRLQLRSILADAGRRGTVVVSTHHTDDVVALCRRVLVLVRGEVRFDGSPAGLADLAAGRVWVDGAERAMRPGALRTWAGPDGTIRAVGSPPPGAQLVAPTVDDGYLILIDERART